MRTTLDLKDDLMTMVHERALQEGKSLKDEMNSLLARGLGLVGGNSQVPELPSYPMGREKVSYVKIWDLAQGWDEDIAADRLEHRK